MVLGYESKSEEKLRAASRGQTVSPLGPPLPTCGPARTPQDSPRDELPGRNYRATRKLTSRGNEAIRWAEICKILKTKRIHKTKMEFIFKRTSICFESQKDHRRGLKVASKVSQGFRWKPRSAPCFDTERGGPDTT